MLTGVNPRILIADAMQSSTTCYMIAEQTYTRGFSEYFFEYVFSLSLSLCVCEHTC